MVLRSDLFLNVSWLHPPLYPELRVILDSTLDQDSDIRNLYKYLTNVPIWGHFLIVSITKSPCYSWLEVLNGNKRPKCHLSQPSCGGPLRREVWLWPFLMDFSQGGNFAFNTVENDLRVTEENVKGPLGAPRTHVHTHTLRGGAGGWVGEAAAPPRLCLTQNNTATYLLTNIQCRHMPMYVHARVCVCLGVGGIIGALPQGLMWWFHHCTHICMYTN